MRIAELGGLAPRASSFSTNSSWMLSCTSRREPAMQVWPVAAKMPEIAPLTASSMIASSNTMLGDLPPSSSDTCLNACAASCGDARAGRRAAGEGDLGDLRMRRPAARRRRAPIAGDDVDDARRERRPPRSPARMNSSSEAEVNSDGLITTVQPAASAGASFQAISSSGEFHGVIARRTRRAARAACRRSGRACRAGSPRPRSCRRGRRSSSTTAACSCSCACISAISLPLSRTSISAR